MRPSMAEWWGLGEYEPNRCTSENETSILDLLSSFPGVITLSRWWMCLVVGSYTEYILKRFFFSRSLLWISSRSRVNPFQAVSFPYHMLFKAFWRDNYVDIICFPVWCQDVFCFSGTGEGTLRSSEVAWEVVEVLMTFWRFCLLLSFRGVRKDEREDKAIMYSLWNVY